MRLNVETNKECLPWKENGWAGDWKCNQKNQYPSICEEEDETFLSHFVTISSQFNVD
jgi:hypothetical protein